METIITVLATVIVTSVVGVALFISLFKRYPNKYANQLIVVYDVRGNFTRSYAGAAWIPRWADTEIISGNHTIENLKYSGSFKTSDGTVQMDLVIDSMVHSHLTYIGMYGKEWRHHLAKDLSHGFSQNLKQIPLSDVELNLKRLCGLGLGYIRKFSAFQTVRLSLTTGSFSVTCAESVEPVEV